MTGQAVKPESWAALGTLVSHVPQEEAATGFDFGPLISARLEFRDGELLARAAGERFELVRQVEAENENFRAYLIVRRS